MRNIPAELAPCGVFCGACPSFGNSCHGCTSEKNQKRVSKWACKIRTCCYTGEKKDFCLECDRFPCTEHKRKLLDSHPDDPRFAYRHEIKDNFRELTALGVRDYLSFQRKKWSCPSCHGRVVWYHYSCTRCGKKME